MTQPEPDPVVPNIGEGPALLYRSSRDPQGVRLIAHVDHQAVEDPRERALCRALLLHALSLLDASEPTSPTGSAR